MDNDEKVIIKNGDIMGAEIVLHMDGGEVKKIILDDLNPDAGFFIHGDGRFVFTGRALMSFVLEQVPDAGKGVG